MLTFAAKQKKKSKLEIIPPNGIPLVTSKNPTPTTSAAPKVSEEQERTSAAPQEEAPPPTQKDAPKGKMPTPIGKIKGSAIRINSKPSEEKEKKQETDLGQRPSTDFTEEELVSAWNKYAQEIKEEGKDSFHNALIKRPPILKENYEVVFMLDNKVQEEILIDQKSELLSHIRNMLNNFSIQLTYEMHEGEDTSEYLSNKDKFLKMAEKNPALLKLRENLDLDIDY